MNYQNAEKAPVSMDNCCGEPTMQDKPEALLPSMYNAFSKIRTELSIELSQIAGCVDSIHRLEPRSGETERPKNYQDDFCAGMDTVYSDLKDLLLDAQAIRRTLQLITGQ